MKSRKLSRNVKGLEDVSDMPPYMMLANEIVLRAIEDWQSLCRGAVECGSVSVSFAELRKFFKSDYCELLLTGTNLSGEYILEELENLREATEYGMSQKTWQKRRAASKAKKR